MNTEHLDDDRAVAVSSMSSPARISPFPAHAIAAATRSVDNALPDPVDALRTEEWLFSETLLEPIPAIERMEAFIGTGRPDPGGRARPPGALDRLP